MSSTTKTTSETVSREPRRDEPRKVVIRYARGELVRGYVSAGDEAAFWSGAAETAVVRTTDGQSIEVRPVEIKAIFFVKSFEGSPDYSEFKVFTNRPNGKGVWVRVHFLDGEIMEGVAPNCLTTYSRTAFYMTPPDPASNNQAVLVSKQYLREMHILGLASD
jgi:hypothetical protein